MERGGSPSSLDDLLALYNDPSERSNGNVRKYFSQEAFREAEETKTSIKNRTYRESSHPIELVTTGKNQGVYWALPWEGNRLLLFPKLNNLAHKNLQSIQGIFDFEPPVDVRSGDRVELVAPAELTTPDGGETWHLRRPGVLEAVSDDRTSGRKRIPTSDSGSAPVLETSTEEEGHSSQLSSTSRKEEELSEIVVGLRAENSQLKMAIAALVEQVRENKKATETEVLRLRRENSDFRSEIAQLRSGIDRRPIGDDELLQVREALSDLQQQVGELGSWKWQVAPLSSLESLQQQISALSDRIDALSGERQPVQDSARDIDIQQLRDEIFREISASLQKQAERIQEAAELQQKTLSEVLDDREERMHDRLAEFRREIERRLRDRRSQLPAEQDIARPSPDRQDSALAAAASSSPKPGMGTGDDLGPALRPVPPRKTKETVSLPLANPHTSGKSIAYGAPREQRLPKAPREQWPPQLPADFIRAFNDERGEEAAHANCMRNKSLLSASYIGDSRVRSLGAADTFRNTYWLVPVAGDRIFGWLFPRLPSVKAIVDAILEDELFMIAEDWTRSSSRTLEVGEPALLEQVGDKEWRLLKPGTLCGEDLYKLAQQQPEP